MQQWHAYKKRRRATMGGNLQVLGRREFSPCADGVRLPERVHVVDAVKSEGQFCLHTPLGENNHGENNH